MIITTSRKHTSSHGTVGSAACVLLIYSSSVKGYSGLAKVDILTHCDPYAFKQFKQAVQAGSLSS